MKIRVISAELVTPEIARKVSKKISKSISRYTSRKEEGQDPTLYPSFLRKVS